MRFSVNFSLLAVATSPLAARVAQGPRDNISVNTVHPIVSGGVAVSQGQIASSVGVIGPNASQGSGGLGGIGNTAGSVSPASSVAGATALRTVGGAKPRSPLEAGVFGGQGYANSQDLPPSASSGGVIASASFPIGFPSASTFTGAPLSVHTVQP
ncbi:hypothetical protein V866_005206 [Kwoniella sp. B9012]|uniref:Uncharacterized protein n=1 Tax=Kwoniella europaea PYCC6329 TaxID=1423913 RepID=A0AAX4KM47_9TREE